MVKMISVSLENVQIKYLLKTLHRLPGHSFVRDDIIYELEQYDLSEDHFN